MFTKYNRGGQPVAHAPYVAHWLLQSGALHLFDDKPLLLTNFFFIFALHRYFSVENRTSEGVKTFFFYFLLSIDIVSGKQDV